MINCSLYFFLQNAPNVLGTSPMPLWTASFLLTQSNVSKMRLAPALIASLASATSLTSCLCQLIFPATNKLKLIKYKNKHWQSYQSSIKGICSEDLQISQFAISKKWRPSSFLRFLPASPLPSHFRFVLFFRSRLFIIYLTYLYRKLRPAGKTWRRWFWPDTWKGCNTEEVIT